MVRLLVVLFCLGRCVVVGTAQTVAVDSLPLRELLDRYSSTTGLRFGFEEAAIQELRVARPREPLTQQHWESTQVKALAARGLAARAVGNGLWLLSLELAELSPEQLAVPAPIHLQILDELGQPLAHAAVVGKAGAGWVADEAGRVNIPAAAWAEGVEIRFVGMASLQVRPGSHPPLTGRLQLEPTAVTTSAAVVVGRLSPKPITPVVSQSASTQLAAQLNISLPARALEDFGYASAAGISRIDHRSSSPAIRGSLPSETLTTLDGLPIYHLDHFFGLFAAIDPALVKDVELYRSHYPAPLGGATGGLLAVGTHTAAAPKLQIEASQLAGSVMAAGAHQGWGLMLAGRHSLGTLANGQLMESTAVDLSGGSSGVETVLRPDFRFGDAYGKLTFAKPNNPLQFQLHAFGSNDLYSYQFDQTRSTTGAADRIVTLNSTYAENSDWNNRGTRANLSYNFGSLNLGLTAHQSSYSQTLSANGNNEISSRRGTRLLSTLNNELDNTLLDRQIGLSLSSIADAEHAKPYTWKAGLQVQQLSAEAAFKLNQRRPVDEQATQEWTHLYTEQILTYRGWTLNGGLRLSHRLDTALLWLSPRIKLARKVGAGAVTGGYSVTQQAIRSLSHENQFGQTYALLVLRDESASMPRGTAHNYTLGYSLVQRGWQLALEGYFRRLEGQLAALSQQVALPRDAQLVNLQPNFLSVAGQGEVIGLDSEVRYVGGKYSGDVAYTLSRSQRQFAAVAGGAWQRAPDDRRHRLASSHSYQWRRWTFGSNFEFASGLAYIDLNVLNPEAGTRANVDPTDYLRSLPAYQRLDLKTHYRFSLGPANVRVGAKLYNVFDRANVTQRQYVVGVGNGDNRRALAVGTDVALLGRLLIGELRLEF